MRLRLRHPEGALEVEVHRAGGAYRVVVDGREYGVAEHVVDADTVLLDVDGRREVVHLARAGAARTVGVRGEVHRFSAESEASAHAAVAALVEPEVRAPMPGKVLEVLVAAGDEVAAGDGLLLLEAMKMENRLTANAAGVVEDVRVAAGDLVDGGQVLLVLRYT